MDELTYNQWKVLQKPSIEKSYAEKISSHSSWYRGRWEIDTCHCGNRMKVPTGKKNHYRCNDCADRAEGLCEY